MSERRGRKPKWASPTTAIRVPEHLAPQLLALARQLEADGPRASTAPGSYLIAIETFEGTERYYVQEPIDLTADETQLLDEAVNSALELMEGLKPDERWLVVGELAKKWGRKITKPKKTNANR